MTKKKKHGYNPNAPYMLERRCPTIPRNRRGGGQRAQRCPGCGGMVYMPCRVCQMRSQT